MKAQHLPHLRLAQPQQFPKPEGLHIVLLMAIQHHALRDEKGPMFAEDDEAITRRF